MDRFFLFSHPSIDAQAPLIVAHELAETCKFFQAVYFPDMMMFLTQFERSAKTEKYWQPSRQI